MAVLLQKAWRKNHKAHAHGRGNGLGKGIQIRHPAPAVNALQRRNGPPGKAQLAVIVVLDHHAVPLLRPAQQLLPPPDGRHQPGGVLVRWGQVCRPCPGGPQGGGVHPLSIQRKRNAAHPAVLIYLPDFRIARVLHRQHLIPAQKLGQQHVEILRPRAHHNLLRRGMQAPVIPQVVADGPSQDQKALIRQGREKGRSLLRQNLTRQTRPRRQRKPGRVHPVCLQVQLPFRFRQRVGLRKVL
ncbi:hypothetical protein SDC9_150916 [bioreactor metagenome]|uniref:Uncharacterized protein n=1 Tax=bioreactor metagenome TaxID=1076179 RepID=A0A645ET60_9ZZZZ